MLIWIGKQQFVTLLDWLRACNITVFEGMIKKSDIWK